MKKVLVTGGSGFIGSHIVEELVRRKYRVVSVDNCRPKKFTGNVGYVNADITHCQHLLLIFEQESPDYIIHCAARARIQPSLQNPVRTYETNVLGTLNLLQSSRKFGVKKFVYSASCSVYAGHTRLPLKESMQPRPLNPYAYSKLMGEMLVAQYVKNFGLKGCSLRYFNVYGPRQPMEGQYATVIGIFLRQFKNSEPFSIVPDGHQRRDFTWVDDVVRANILAMESEKVGKGEVINIGGGRNHSILEVADVIGGKDYPRIFIEPRLGEAREALADNSKAKRLLKWEPMTSFEEGIKILKKGLK